MSDRTDERVTEIQQAVAEMLMVALRGDGHTAIMQHRDRIDGPLASLAADAAETQKLREINSELVKSHNTMVRAHCNERDRADAAEARFLDVLEASASAEARIRAERDAAVADRNRLAEALREFGKHKPNCEIMLPRHACSCGFDAALASREGSDDA